MAEEPEIIKLTSPHELASVLPAMMGYYPSESLVVVGMDRPDPERGEQLSFTARIDLPSDDADLVGIVHALTRRFRGYTGAAVIVFTEQATDGADRPYTRLVELAVRGLDLSGVRVADACLVRDGMVYPYLCENPDCCPPEGRPLRTEAGDHYTAANVVRGHGPVASRAEMLAFLDADDPAGPAVVEQLLLRPTLEADACWSTLQACVTDAGVVVEPASAAAIAYSLHMIDVRDAIVQRLAENADADGLVAAVLRRIVQMVPSPYDVPLLTVTAISAYLQGDGVIAFESALRALCTDESYALARLVMLAYNDQVSPTRLREFLVAAGGGGDLNAARCTAADATL